MGGLQNQTPGLAWGKEGGNKKKKIKRGGYGLQ